MSDEKTANQQDIPCPNCGQPVTISGTEMETQCHTCGRTILLASHICPYCYHYHERETAVCQQCGASINRLCQHCHTPNWGGNENCYQCGQPLDIIELMSTHAPQATTARLQRQMTEAQAFKQIEEEASQKRMAELEAIEIERQTELRQRLQKKRQQERRMLLVTFSIVAVFLIVLAALALINA